MIKEILKKAEEFTKKQLQKMKPKELINKVLETQKDLYEDSLTKLFNRRWLEDNEEGILENYNFLILIDIDHFKKINDAYGHQKGDEILKKVSEIVLEATEFNTVVRWGGEEIVAFGFKTTEKEDHTNIALAEDIRKAIEEHTAKTGIPVTVSIGMSLLEESIDESFAKADCALYVSKEQGRNQVTMHEDSMQCPAHIETDDKSLIKSKRARLFNEFFMKKDILYNRLKKVQRNQQKMANLRHFKDRFKVGDRVEFLRSCICRVMSDNQNALMVLQGASGIIKGIGNYIHIDLDRISDGNEEVLGVNKDTRVLKETVFVNSFDSNKLITEQELEEVLDPETGDKFIKGIDGNVTRVASNRTHLEHFKYLLGIKKYIDKNSSIAKLTTEYKDILNYKAKDYEYIKKNSIKGKLSKKEIDKKESIESIASLQINGEVVGIEFNGKDTILSTSSGIVYSDLPVLEEISKCFKANHTPSGILFGELYAVDPKGNPLSFLQTQVITRNPITKEDKDRIHIILFDTYSLNNKKVTGEYWENFSLINKMFNKGIRVKPAASRKGRIKGFIEFWNLVKYGTIEESPKKKEKQDIDDIVIEMFGQGYKEEEVRKELERKRYSKKEIERAMNRAKEKRIDNKLNRISKLDREDISSLISQDKNFIQGIKEAREDMRKGIYANINDILGVQNSTKTVLKQVQDSIKTVLKEVQNRYKGRYKTGITSISVTYEINDTESYTLAYNPDGNYEIYSNENTEVKTHGKYDNILASTYSNMPPDRLEFHLYQDLIHWYDKNMKKGSIAVDFDGVIAENKFPAVGPPIEGVKEALLELSKDYKIIIYTARVNDSQEGQYEIVMNWLKENDITYDIISIGTKPIATFYIDDRAIRFESWEQAQQDVKKLDKESSLIVKSQDDSTEEMKEHFDKRTNMHIDLVKKYLDKIKELDLPDIDSKILEEEKEHDGSKFEEPEYSPYLHVSWKYKMQDEGEKYEPSKEIEDKMHEATEHHVLTNKHHPEYWSVEHE